MNNYIKRKKKQKGDKKSDEIW